MGDTLTQEAENWIPAAETATDKPEAEVKAPEPVKQPQGKTYSEEEVANIKKAEREAVKLELRHEITATTKRIKELEGKAQLTERQEALLLEMKSRLDDQEDLLATVADGVKGQGTELPTDQPQSYRARVLAKRQERANQKPPANPEPEKPQWTPQQLEAFTEIKALADEAGLDMNGPELSEAAKLFSQGRNYKAMQSAEKAVEKAKADKENKSKAETEKRTKAEETAKRNSVETGAGGGASAGVAQVRQDFIAGKISSVEYADKMRKLGLQP